MSPVFIRPVLSVALIVASGLLAGSSWLSHRKIQEADDVASARRTLEKAHLTEKVEQLRSQLSRRPTESTDRNVPAPALARTLALAETMRLLAPAFRTLHGVSGWTLQISSGAWGKPAELPAGFVEAFALTSFEKSALEDAMTEARREVGERIAARAVVKPNVQQGQGTVVIEHSPLPEAPMLASALLSRFRDILGSDRFGWFETINAESLQKSFYRFGAEPTTFTVTYEAGVPVRLQFTQPQAKFGVTMSVPHDVLEAFDFVMSALPPDRLDPALVQPFLDDHAALGEETAALRQKAAALKSQLGNDFMKQKVAPALKAYKAAHDDKEPSTFLGLKDLQPYFPNEADAKRLIEEIDRIETRGP